MIGFVSGFKVSLASLIGYCENGAAPSEQLGKLLELATGPFSDS